MFELLNASIYNLCILSSNATMPHEVACVDISPLGGQEASKASFCAIGLWTEISVSLLRLPTLQQVDNQLLGGGEREWCWREREREGEREGEQEGGGRDWQCVFSLGKLSS